jgi:hypothetical protein
MGDKLRSVNTRFWEDPFIEGLPPNEKLLFLYLLTNPLTNLMGIYEITIKRISYDTGITKESIEKGLKRFERVRKAFIIDNYLILPNFLKNQSLNDNMKTGVVKLFKSLPNTLKEKLLGNDYQTIQNDYQTFRNGLLKLNGIEREEEKEIEIKLEKENPKKGFTPPLLEDVIIYFKENGYSEQSAKKMFNSYSVANWIDSKGNAVKNWKQKAINVWFKPENLDRSEPEVKAPPIPIESLKIAKSKGIVLSVEDDKRLITYENGQR